MTEGFTLEIGDCRDTMRRWARQGIKAQTCVTSPPYFGLRDYGVDGQLGLEQTPEQYIAAMVEVFRCVREVLADDGTLWLNIGDSWASGKQLIGVPWRLAFALQADGWILRQEIIWHKTNAMPEPARDRCVQAHEHVFLLSKQKKYFFNREAIQEPVAKVQPPRRFGRKEYEQAQKDGGYAAAREIAVSTGQGTDNSAGNHYGRVFGGETHRNKRSVWVVPFQKFSGAHFATYPPALIEPCILAGSRPGDIVLDPFGGSGTTAQVALQHGRRALLCELNPAYAPLIEQRVCGVEFAESLPTMHPTLVPKFHAFLRRIQEGIAA